VNVRAVQEHTVQCVLQAEAEALLLLQAFSEIFQHRVAIRRLVPGQFARTALLRPTSLFTSRGRRKLWWDTWWSSKTSRSISSRRPRPVCSRWERWSRTFTQTSWLEIYMETLEKEGLELTLSCL
jgi:hypothetical protein